MTRDMYEEDGASGQEPAGRAAAIPSKPLTAEERRTAELLTASLRQLQTARPGFQEGLEARLLARLTETAAIGAAVTQPAPTRSRLLSWRLPRRSLLGVAAASAVALLAGSLAVPFVGAPGVSAREILEKAQANVDNPVLAGVRSYHLTAKIWNNRRPEGAPAGLTGPTESVTEQWFVAPDKMRTETRSTDRDGKPVVSGFMMNGSEAKHYSTDGANDTLMIGVFAVPAVATSHKPDGQQAGRPVGAGAGAPPSGSVDVVTAGRAVPAASPAPGEKPHTVTAVAVTRRTEGRPVAAPSESGQPAASAGVRVAIRERTDDAGDGAEANVEAEVVVIGADCPEPRRTGEGMVAGRAVFVIESDLSGCLPADAPDELRGRHIRWVDQKTYLPLKMEMYAHSGQLVDRYEVTSIAYDIGIPAQTFSELPAGTSLREPKFLPPIREGAGPEASPTTRP